MPTRRKNQVAAANIVRSAGWLFGALIFACSPLPAEEVPVTTLAHGCIACHGADATPRGGEIPPLAGRDAEALLDLLQAYRSDGAAESTSMHRLTGGYSDDELAALAQYFSEQAQ